CLGCSPYSLITRFGESSWENLQKHITDMKTAFFILVLTIGILKTGWAQDSHGAAGPAIHSPGQIKWQDGPPSLPRGAKFAVLEGDPSKEGIFTMRVWLPDAYRLPPHTHPKVEHVTVISGTFNFGMGDKFDQNATKEMPTGTFGY